MDEEGILSYQYGISAYPITFIIDKDGYIKQYVLGAMNKDTMKLINNRRINKNVKWTLYRGHT